MTLTRRGYAVLGICALALALGAAFGARALNAVVVPGLVALVAGWIGTRRASRPTVTRSRPAPGFPGDERTISLEIDAERGTTATVRDLVGDGLSASERGIDTGIPGRVEYDCRLERRGEQTIGPTIVTVTDALGLFRREFRSATRTDVLVYPPVRRLSNRARSAFLVGEETPLSDRGEFDSLREYVPGDPLRDVNWKGSAKRDAFVVTEFAADEDDRALAIAAEAAPGEADAMATAAASVACWLLDTGVELDLATPDGRLSGANAETRERVLALLARTGAGRVATRRREDADVVIAAESDGVTITAGVEAFPFDRLVEPNATDRPRSRDEPAAIGSESDRDGPQWVGRSKRARTGGDPAEGGP